MASFTQQSFERPIGGKDWRKDTYTGNKWKVTRTLQPGDMFAMPASDDHICLHAATNGDEWRWVLVMRQVKPAAWRFFSKNWPYYMVLNAKERQQGKAKQPVALPTSFAPAALGIAGSVDRTMCRACMIYLEPKQHCCKVRCPVCGKVCGPAAL